MKDSKNNTIRPWGNFKIIHKELGITIKIININSSSRLSLQSHEQRNEIWMLLKGEIFYQIGLRIEEMKKGKIYHVLKKRKHRLMTMKKGGSIIEISFGKFNEKDIIRYEDDYGRIKK